jgi:hypothetical protein
VEVPATALLDGDHRAYSSSVYDGGACSRIPPDKRAILIVTDVLRLTRHSQQTRLFNRESIGSHWRKDTGQQACAAAILSLCARICPAWQTSGTFGLLACSERARYPWSKAMTMLAPKALELAIYALLAMLSNK